MKEKFILLVDDNPDDVKLTVRALRKSDIRNDIVVAKDGVEALDFLFAEGAHADRDAAHMPQVMLLDLKMPRLGGLEVLQRMRSDERTKLLPVVVLTTSSEDRDRIESYHLGANSYVRKPVDYDRFSEAIRLLGSYWLHLNEAP